MWKARDRQKNNKWGCKKGDEAYDNPHDRHVPLPSRLSITQSPSPFFPYPAPHPTPPHPELHAPPTFYLFFFILITPLSLALQFQILVLCDCHCPLSPPPSSFSLIILYPSQPPLLFQFPPTLPYTLASFISLSLTLTLQLLLLTTYSLLVNLFHLFNFSLCILLYNAEHCYFFHFLSTLGEFLVNFKFLEDLVLIVNLPQREKDRILIFIGR